MAYQNPNLLPADVAGFETSTVPWIDAVNCTMSLSTSDYRSGTRALRLTAQSAGTVQASTPLVSGMTPGVEYTARVPIRVSSTTAGKSFTTRITYYPADSDAPIVSRDSEPIALGTSVGWFKNNYAAVALRAPEGAARVQLTVIVTGMAKGEYVSFDDVYLGVAPAPADNLIPFDDSSFEGGVGGWEATNAELSRVSGSIGNNGEYVLGAVAAGSGTFEARTRDAYPVTPGVDYVAYAAASASPSNVAGALSIEWYDEDDQPVGRSTSNVTLTSSLRLGTCGRPPEGAVSMRPVVTAQAAAQGATFWLDAVSLQVAPNPADNLLDYNEYSIERDAASWVPDGCTLERKTLLTEITDGRFALYITPDAPGKMSVTLDRLIPVSAGETYRTRAVFIRQITSPGEVVDCGIRFRMDWFDESGSIVLADVPDGFTTSSSDEEAWGMIVTETRTAPANAAYVRIGFEIDATNPLIDLVVADCFEVSPATSEYTLSTDSETACITLRVDFVPETGANTRVLTIRRFDEDGTATPVRTYGQEYVLVPYGYSPVLVEDYEAPLGTRVWYEIVWSDETGAQRSWRIATSMVDTPTLEDASYVWFKSPGNPALNTTVMMENPITWQRQARMAAYQIVGRRNPVVVSDVRPGRTASLSILIWDEQSNALFDELLDSGFPVLIQAMPGYGVDGNLYLAIQDVEVESATGAANIPGWRWTLAVTEVDRPVGGLQGSANGTWQTVYDTFATWQEVFESFDTWTDVLVYPAGTSE